MPAELSYRLAELILAESARAGLGPGSRLPTERRLAADMGATRTSIRHALAVLEAQGHISREVGRGTFLRHDPAQRGATDRDRDRKLRPGGSHPGHQCRSGRQQRFRPAGPGGQRGR